MTFRIVLFSLFSFVTQEIVKISKYKTLQAQFHNKFYELRNSIFSTNTDDGNILFIKELTEMIRVRLFWDDAHRSLYQPQMRCFRF